MLCFSFRIRRTLSSMRCSVISPASTALITASKASVNTCAILVEVSAAGGSFCISFMQMFAEDNYLNAFLNELSQQGIDYEIADRHKVILAPISDYREKMDISAMAFWNALLRIAEDMPEQITP